MNANRFWTGTTALIVTLCAAFAAEPLRADATEAEAVPNHPLLSDSFIFFVGGYYPQVQTSASLEPTGGGAGPSIDFEDSLGLSDADATLLAGFHWRATERWRAEVEYFALNRDATRTLASDLEWGDEFYPAGTEVDSTFDFSDIRVSGTYSFFKRPDKELGLGLGLHVADIKASIRSTGNAAEGADVLAPLPVVNFYALFALTDKWAISMRADWLSLTYGDYSGDIRGMGMDVLYQPFRNVGFGLGARSLAMDIKIEHSDWTGKARLSFQGPTAYVTASF